MCRVFRKTGCLGEHGFTMIEVLGAIVILAITIVPMLGLFTVAPALHLQREYLTRAAFLAQVRTEETKNKLIESFDGSTIVSPGSFPVSEGFEPSDSGYKYIITFGSGDELKDLTVRVWHDDNGDNSPDAGEQIVTIQTRVSRRR